MKCDDCKEEIEYDKEDDRYFFLKCEECNGDFCYACSNYSMNMCWKCYNNWEMNLKYKQYLP